MYIRGASGEMINSDHVLCFAPAKSKQDGTFAGWWAVFSNGTKRLLDPFYASEPGRLEMAIGFVPPEAKSELASKARDRR
jgi:hypothetical protein